MSPVSSAALAALTVTFCLVGAPHSAWGQSAEPLHTIISVHLDAATGDITVGSTVYPGANPGMHLLAFSRKPDQDHLDAPDLIKDGTFHDASSANQFLEDVLHEDSGAFLIVNAVVKNAADNYGFALSAIAENLEKFGAQTDIKNVNSAIPFAFLGNGGRSEGQALQRGFSTLNLDGYLATDSNTNYTFIQTDYVRYDITTNGTIKIGNTTYKAADAVSKYGNCDAVASDSFHLVIVDRESPNVRYYDNTYCTRQSPSSIGDLTGLLNRTNSESNLFFIASNGHPIPANWNFGTDGDARIYPLAKEIVQLGGYFETMVYLTPNDTYSLVGAAAPPAGTPEAANRARESSSVYPDHPTGELHGELARGRGNWYSPVDADTTGQANLDYYQILAQPSVPFPHPCRLGEPGCNPQEYLAERAAFQYISNALCGGCNPRNNYPNTSIQMSTYITPLSVMNDPSTNQACPIFKPVSPFCIVRDQLMTEFQDVDNIRGFDKNLADLWQSEGTVTIFKLLQVSNDLLAHLPPPKQPTTPNLVEPIVSFFLGLGSEIPKVGELFGIAETAFHFATSLTTEENGNEQLLSYVETTSTLQAAISALAGNASSQFQDQGKTTGTQFDFIYQDWGKINRLGTALASGSPGWVWNSGDTAAILRGMSPAIEASYYQSLMPAMYAIGSYLPKCYLCQWPNNAWGTKPIYLQPSSYTVNDPDFQHGGPGLQKVYPFWTAYPPPSYFPYTFPTDSDNPYNPDSVSPGSESTQNTNTLLADGSWLAISWQKSPPNGGANGFYDPPAKSVLTHLFTPQSEGGLGVYRPAFFEGWPFPRVTCGYSDSGSGNPGPGCNWGAAAPSPDAVPEPFTSVSIAPGISTQKLAGKDQIQVPLTVTNNGTLEIQSIQIDEVPLRTLAGSGEAVLADPLLPVKLGGLAPGNSTTLNLVITVPSSVQKLAVTEQGTATNNDGAPPAEFSFGQAIFPGKQQ